MLKELSADLGGGAWGVRYKAQMRSWLHWAKFQYHVVPWFWVRTTCEQSPVSCSQPGAAGLNSPARSPCWFPPLTRSPVGWLLVQEKRVGRQGDWSSVKLQKARPPSADGTKRIRECAGCWVCWVLAGHLSWGRTACCILGVGEGLGEGFNVNRAFLGKAKLNWLMKLPRLFLTTESK